MEIKLDLSKEYAIALEGGRCKKVAYEIGVWQSFWRKVGSQNDCAVSGSSVGSL